jgi:hypothetical protein
MISSLGSKVEFWIPKGAKELRRCALLHERLLLGRGGVLGGLSWGLMHWKAWRRLLVFRSGDLGQHSSIISWRAFIYEEGAPSGLTVSFLERVLAIRTERYQLQSIHSSRTAIPVEGILYLTSQLHFRADLAVERGAHHIWASDLQLSLIASPVGVAIVPGSLLYCIYCFRSLILRYIHHIPKLVFPRGVLSRVLDQKYLCLHMHFSGC